MTEKRTVYVDIGREVDAWVRRRSVGEVTPMVFVQGEARDDLVRVITRLLRDQEDGVVVK